MGLVNSFCAWAIKLSGMVLRPTSKQTGKAHQAFGGWRLPPEITAVLEFVIIIIISYC